MVSAKWEKLLLHEDTPHNLLSLYLEYSVVKQNKTLSFLSIAGLKTQNQRLSIPEFIFKMNAFGCSYQNRRHRFAV